MSKYTTQLRFICEQYSGATVSKDYMGISETIENARSKIFDKNYPIFDETYRSVIESKILEHYYLKEIGYETVALWKFALNRRMAEIMPYYNKLYESEKLEFNPFDDTNLVTEHVANSNANTTNTQENTNTNTNTKITSGESQTNSENEKTILENIETTNNGDNSENNWGYFNDTPQGGVDGLNFTGGNLDYLTTANHTTVSGTHNENVNSDKNGASTSATNIKNNYKENDTITNNNNETKKQNIVAKNTDEYVNTIKGKQGGASYSQLLKEYRDSLINIDMMVIEQLSDLFITLW